MCLFYVIKFINGYCMFFFYRIKLVNEMKKDDDYYFFFLLWVYKK